MGEGTNGVEAPPAASAPPQQPATGAAPPSSSPDDDDDARTQDPDNNAKNEAGAAAGDQDQQPNQEAEAAEKAHGAGGAVTQAEEKPTPGTGASWPATPPGARTPPQRDVAPAPRTGDRNARAATETEPDVEAAKPGPGCTTPPPPPAHDSEASEDGRGSPLHQGKPGASVAAASRSRLLAFRSFSRDKKANKSDTAEHKEKGKERRKRFWK
jgi:hypothetical protein